LAFIALLTIIMESFNDRSASLMNYSAPPLKIIVADCVYLIRWNNKKYIWTLCEQIESLCSYLFLLKSTTRTQHLRLKTINCGLYLSSC
jgi:hypothetical protein